MAELTASITKKTVDFSLIAFGVTLIIVSGYSIWSTSYTRQSSSLPSGKILKCIGGCKYKSPDDYFWLDGQNELDVLDKSMVFTPNNSTASIVLKSGTKITLYPNSLVQITNGSKGSSIDIIEGKINFEKIAARSIEKVTIKGKEIPMPIPALEESPEVENELTEISAAPELLEVNAPSLVRFRSSPAVVNLEIQNGTAPFSVYLEGNQTETIEKSSSTKISYKIKEAGIYNLKIEDANGASVSKFLTIEDLTTPEILIPKSGDVLYVKTFRPAGTFEPDSSEFEIQTNNSIVFKGPLSKIPRDLLPGFYSLRGRRVKDSEFSEWSSPVSFQIVETKRPLITIGNQTTYFNQANLRWKKAIGGVHLLRIKDESKQEILKISTNEESFAFNSRSSGKYSWNISPINEDQIDEKDEWTDFYIVETTHLLHWPPDKEKIITENLNSPVVFKWANLPKQHLNVKLEIRDQKNKKMLYDVTGDQTFELELKNINSYKWKLVLQTNTESISTPEYTFDIDAPPPMRPISSDEIIFKD